VQWQFHLQIKPVLTNTLGTKSHPCCSCWTRTPSLQTMQYLLSVFLLLNKTSHTCSLRKAAVTFLTVMLIKVWYGCFQKYCSMHYDIFHWVNIAISKQSNKALRSKSPYKWISKGKNPKATNFRVKFPQLSKDIM